MQARSTPLLAPAMPPTSVVSVTVSVPVRVSMVMSDTLTSFCCTVVFTPALFSQFLTTPWFSPTMPPIK